MESTLVASANAGYRLGFTSLDQEVHIAALPVQGSLPSWLSGTLLRNGPARFGIGSERYRHWFDGLAMLHRFAIGAGRVGYANRFLRSPGFVEAERTGRIARPEFATDPHRTLVELITSSFGRGSSDNANVNIVPFADRYLALTETPAPVAFDGDTLETRGVLAYDDDVAGQVTTAHTHHDRARRATFNVVTEISRKSSYKIVRIADGTLRRTVVASLAVDEPAYLHAFSTTARAVIVAEYPFVVRPLDLALRRKPFIENFHWKPQRGVRFHAIDKDTGVCSGSYESDAFFAFHHVNAYDEGDAVVLDLCAYDDASIIGDFMLDNLRAPGNPRVARPELRRYRLVPGRTAAQRESAPDVCVELPAIAPARMSAPHRFAYGIENVSGGTDLFGRIAKADMHSGTSAFWTAPGAHCGEPVFVPRPGAADEDDGVLLSVVLDEHAGCSFLLVLDARTLEERARALVPHHIPFGFHGLFR